MALSPITVHHRDVTDTFKQLTRLRAFEKKFLPYLVTIEDFDIVRSIGVRQETGKLFLLKHLYLEGIGSVATVTRRLNKLRAQGTLIALPHGADKRNITLTLAPTVLKAYARYGVLLTSMGEITRPRADTEAL